MRTDPKTPRKLQVQIDCFLIERLFGRAQQPVALDGGDGGPIVFQVITKVPLPGGRP